MVLSSEIPVRNAPRSLRFRVKEPVVVPFPAQTDRVATFAVILKPDPRSAYHMPTPKEQFPIN